MKCLSVQQPWAWAIIHGPKRIENRTWPTNYRGPLLIHVGKSRARLGDYGVGEPREQELAFGALLGTVQLVDCLRVDQVRHLNWASQERFIEGPYCWILEDPRPLKTPIPYRGQQQLFDVPDEFLKDPIGYMLVSLN